MLQDNSMSMAREESPSTRRAHATQPLLEPADNDDDDNNGSGAGVYVPLNAADTVTSNSATSATQEARPAGQRLPDMADLLRGGHTAVVMSGSQQNGSRVKGVGSGMDSYAQELSRNSSAEDVLDSDASSAFSSRQDLTAGMAQPLDDSVMRRFGLWDGVFATCLLGLFGVILFLRLGFLAGIAGVFQMSCVVLLSAGVSLLTSLSLSAVCTNGQLLGGGAYYMISRSLGPEFGGVIGVIFSLANMVSVALYTVGFSETVVEQLPKFLDDEINEVRVVGVCAVVVILFLCLVGVDWVIKLQLGLLAVLLSSLVLVSIGCFVRSDSEQGFDGVNGHVLKDNWGSKYGEGQSFFWVLSVFFPAYCGLMAGANMSGEIRNAEKNIPKGTIIAVCFATFWYLSLVWLMGSTVPREGSTNNGDTGLAYKFIMTDLCLVDYIVFFGIYAATASSAVSAMVGAPRILQAVALDGIFPVLTPFAKGHGATNEPFRGYIVTFFVSLGCILIGKLDAIAPIITAFFMMAYALVNLACFAASASKSPGWRPSFHFYSKWGAFAGFTLCLGLMFLMNWYYAIGTVVISGALYGYVLYAAPDISWGSAPEARVYVEAFRFLRRLDTIHSHVKNYRPQLLVLVGEPHSRRGLVQFADQLRKSGGMHIFANILQADLSAKTICDGSSSAAGRRISRMRNQQKMDRETNPMHFHRLHAQGLRRIKGFHETMIANSLHNGLLSLLQVAGVSKLRPNVLMMGYRDVFSPDKLDPGPAVVAAEDKEEEKRTQPLEQQDPQVVQQKLAEEYCEMIRTAFFFNFGVAVVRSHHALTMESYDETKRPTGTIDIWWLDDDGGLTILLPFLLHKHPVWALSRVRLMVPTAATSAESSTFYNRGAPENESMRLTQAHGLDEEQLEQISLMEEMLSRWRISAEIVAVDSSQRVREETKQQFQDLGGDAEIVSPSSRSPVAAHLQCIDLVHRYSQDASLVVYSLPIPEFGIRALDYMAVLECISRPFNDRGIPSLFIRGANQEVLTFNL